MENIDLAGGIAIFVIVVQVGSMFCLAVKF